MPFYEYECESCKYYTEIMQKISDAPLTKCPSCGKNQLKKLISAPVFRLKGSGWYETDFKSDKENRRNLAAGEKEESKEAKPAEAAAGESKTTEAKPAEAKASEPKAAAPSEPRRKSVAVSRKPAAKAAAKAKPAKRSAAKTKSKTAARKARR